MKAMRHRTIPAVVLCAVLASCQVAPLPTPRPTASKAPQGSSPTARPSGAAAGVARGQVALLRPAPAAAKLTGQVFLEAGYATTLGGATRLLGADGATLIGMDGATLAGNEGGALIGNASGAIVAAGGGNVIVPSRLIGHPGGTLIGPDGASLIGADGASLIGPDGASLIGPDGASLIGADGASLVGADGTSLVGADGASLAGAGEASLAGADGASLAGAGGASLVRADGLSLTGAPRFTLAQDLPKDGLIPLSPRMGGSGAAAPAFGELWPAIGTWLSVVDDRTGFTVPLGKDERGADVYTVYTDAKGQYEVFVAPEYVGHVRVVARAPGARDTRMLLGVFEDGKAARRVDDDQSAVAQYMRYMMAGVTVNILGLPGWGQGPGGKDEVAPELAFAKAAMGDVARALEEVGWRDFDPIRQEALALVMAGWLLEKANLKDVRLSTEGKALFDPTSGPRLDGRPILDEMATILGDIRKAAIRDLPPGESPAAHFAKKPYLIAANLRRKPADQYVITRSADLVDFVLREYMTSPQPNQARLMFDVGNDLGLPLGYRDSMSAASEAMVGAMVAIFADPEGGKVEEWAALIRKTGLALKRMPVPAPPPRTIPAAPPLPVAPAVGRWDVQTVAGVAYGAGSPTATYEGPAREVSFSWPRGLALDESGPTPVLYVADHTGSDIRRVTFDAAGGATVAVVAGMTGQAGNADGPAREARFSRPEGLAIDAEHNLYVADGGNQRIRKVTFGAAGATVSTIAGQGPAEGGFLDGPGDRAQFKSPGSLVLDPSGALVVTDGYNDRIRKITFSGGQAQVSTLLGDGQSYRAEGPLTLARTRTPAGLALAPDGSVYFSEVNSNGPAIRQIAAPLAPESRTRFVAGGLNKLPERDGFWASAWFQSPIGLAVDPAGRVVVADLNDHRIRLVTPDGWVGTLAGGGTEGGYADGDGATARFNGPSGIAVGKDGTIYVADTLNHVIRRLKPL